MQIQGTRAAIARPVLKGPITLVNVMRRETMQLSMPFKR
jgi:hypothetical protein